MTMEHEQHVSAVRDLAGRLLREARFTGPPVHPLLLGARADLRFRVAAFGDGAQGYRIEGDEGGRTVVLNSRDHPEDQLMSAAEAIIECQFTPPAGAGEAERRLLRVIGAAELMMPETWFREALETFGCDLPALKRRFGVSFEAAAWRVLDFRPAVLTVFDNGEPRYRAASRGVDYPPEPLPIEAEVAARCHDEWTPQRASGEGVDVECFPTFRSARQRRVILFTSPRD